MGYKNAARTYRKATWSSINGAWYACNEAGMVTGRKYLNPASSEMLLGWQNINGKYYYFNTGNSRPQDVMYAKKNT